MSSTEDKRSTSERRSHPGKPETDVKAGIVVYGATGLVGGRVCAALDEQGIPFIAAGRTKHRLDNLAAVVGAAGVRVAGIDDAASLQKAFDGARVVVNCAGPLAEVGEPILLATLAAGAHYIDLGGDQTFLHHLYERHDSTARRAGTVVVPGCGINCALGDWAASWAATHVCGMNDEGDVVRAVVPPRAGEDRPLDDVAVSYVYDDLVLSPGSQRAVFNGLHTRALVWRRDRWESVKTAAEKRNVNVGPVMGGVRDVVSFPGGDVITVPRHVSARQIQTYVSTTRSVVAQTALRFLARAMPLVPRRATDVLATYQPAEDEYKRTRFAVIAQARRGFEAAQVALYGEDHYRASATISAWIAQHLVARGAGPVGMRAPSELFRAAAALRGVGALIGMRVEPSFA